MTPGGRIRSPNLFIWRTSDYCHGFFCQLSPKTFGIYSKFGEKTGMLCVFVPHILWRTQNNPILNVTWKRLLRNDLKCWQFKCSVSHNYSSPLGLLNWLITGSWHKFKSRVETHAYLLIITAIFWLDKQRNHILSCRDTANAVRSEDPARRLWFVKSTSVETAAPAPRHPGLIGLSLCRNIKLICASSVWLSRLLPFFPDALLSASQLTCQLAGQQGACPSKHPGGENSAAPPRIDSSRAPEKGVKNRSCIGGPAWAVLMSVKI